MINILTNFLLMVLRIFSKITFGVFDNLAFVYAVLIATSIFILLILNKYFELFKVFEYGTRTEMLLIFASLILNALPQWYFWLFGLALLFFTYYKQGSRMRNDGIDFAKFKDKAKGFASEQISKLNELKLEKSKGSELEAENEPESPKNSSLASRVPKIPRV